MKTGVWPSANTGICDSCPTALDLSCLPPTLPCSYGGQVDGQAWVVRWGSGKAGSDTPSTGRVVCAGPPSHASGRSADGIGGMDSSKRGARKTEGGMTRMRCWVLLALLRCNPAT